MPERLLRKQQVKERLGNMSSDTTFDDAMVRWPDFPRPVDLPGVPRWRESDVDGWIRSLALKESA